MKLRAVLLILLLSPLFTLYPRDLGENTAREVRIGIFPFEPINFVDKGGYPSGLYPSLIYEITKDTEWTVRYVEGSWDEGLERLQRGEIDLVMSVAWSQSRSEVMDFSKESVVELWGQVFTRPGSPVKNINDLEGTVVGVMKNDITGQNLVKTAENLDIHFETAEFPTFMDVMTAVENGNVTAGAAPQHFGLRHAAEYHLIGTNIMFSPFSIYFAAKKGTNQDLLTIIDRHMAEWKSDRRSVYYQKIQYWMSPPELRNNSIPLWLKAVVFILVVFTLVITTVSVMFKMIVNKRTGEIRNKEEQYRTLVEQIKGIILRISPEGEVLLINDFGLNLLGVSEDEILHKNILTLGILPETLTLEKIRHPEDLAQINLVTNIGSPENKVVLQWSLNTILDEDGVLEEILCLGVDITTRIAMENALKESEGKFISFMNNIPAYAFIKNEKGEHIYSNPASLALLKDPPERPSAIDFHKIPEEREIIRKAERRILTGQSQLESFEFEARLGSSEEPVLLQEKRFPIIMKDGSMLVGGIAFDITESREREEQLNQSRKMQAIGVLAGGIAHDFNNQLSGIMGYADLLTNNISDPALTRYASKLMESIDRASQVTQQLLRFSRKEKRETGIVDINDLIDDLINLLKHSIEKGITIEFSRKTDVSLIRGDRPLLQNALLNISLNARDAMEGSGSLLFTTERVYVDEKMTALQGDALLPGEYLVVSVEDTGPGIPRQVKDKIFEPFFTTKPSGKGTGMGLAMVYAAIKEHHGNITVQSTEGKGTVFKLYIPGIEETGEMEPVVEKPVEPSARNARIAVVDDEMMIRDFLEISLKDAGHTPVLFEGGQEFIETLEKDKKSFDLVIMDMIMPGLSGLETYQAISRICPGLPVLLSSGYSPRDDLKEIMRNPAVQYLQKPYSIKNLLKTIQNMVGE